jgi:hypothetical protein
MNPVLLIMRDPSRPQMPRARRDKESRHSRCIASRSLLQARRTLKRMRRRPRLITAFWQQAELSF